MRIMKSCHGGHTIIFLTKLFFGWTIFSVEALQLSTSNNEDWVFAEGSNVTFVCNIDPYTGIQAWIFNSTDVARCAFTTCVQLDTMNGSFTFTQNVTAGIFYWTINRMELTFNNTEFKCTDGSRTVGNVTTIVRPCGATPSIEHGNCVLDRAGYTAYGAKATVSCSTLYATDKDKITCTKSSMWEVSACEFDTDYVSLFVIIGLLCILAIVVLFCCIGAHCGCCYIEACSCLFGFIICYFCRCKATSSIQPEEAETTPTSVTFKWTIHEDDRAKQPQLRVVSPCCLREKVEIDKSEYTRYNLKPGKIHLFWLEGIDNDGHTILFSNVKKIKTHTKPHINLSYDPKSLTPSKVTLTWQNNEYLSKMEPEININPQTSEVSVTVEKQSGKGCIKGLLPDCQYTCQLMFRTAQKQMYSVAEILFKTPRKPEIEIVEEDLKSDTLTLSLKKNSGVPSNAYKLVKIQNGNKKPSSIPFKEGQQLMKFDSRHLSHLDDIKYNMEIFSQDELYSESNTISIKMLMKSDDITVLPTRSSTLSLLCNEKEIISKENVIVTCRLKQPGSSPSATKNTSDFCETKKTFEFQNLLPRTTYVFRVYGLDTLALVVSSEIEGTTSE